MNEFGAHLNWNVAFRIKQREDAPANTVASFKDSGGEACAGQFG
jgi:hypothetical protein